MAEIIEDQQGNWDEQAINSEREKDLENIGPKPNIRLEFFRHGPKQNAGQAGLAEGDNQVRLTETGRMLATQKGKRLNIHPEVAVTYASPRERTQETVLRYLLAEEEAIDTKTTLEQMREYIRHNISQIGKEKRKDSILKELDFNWDGTEGFRTAAEKAYDQEKEAMDFFFHESDMLTVQKSDRESTSYTRNAANIASIILKYVKALPRWERIIQENAKREKPQNYREFGNELQRLFASHSTVIECFLIKIIECTKGKMAAEQFVENMRNPNGFDECEGYSIDIQNQNGGIEITLIYGKQEFRFGENILKFIINDSKRIDQRIRR